MLFRPISTKTEDCLLSNSLLRCGPAWAWTKDPLIMSQVLLTNWATGPLHIRTENSNKNSANLCTDAFILLFFFISRLLFVVRSRAGYPTQRCIVCWLPLPAVVVCPIIYLYSSTLYVAWTVLDTVEMTFGVARIALRVTSSWQGFGWLAAR